MSLLLAVLAFLSPASPGSLAGSVSDGGSPEVARVVEGWRTSPVYVDEPARSSVPDAEAVRLSRRVDAQNPPIRIAVLPSTALAGTSPSAFLDAVVGAAQADGVYLLVVTPVPGQTAHPSGPTAQPSGPTAQPSGPTAQPSGPTAPSGVVAVGRAVGTSVPVAEALAAEQSKEPVALLDGVLTRLGVPASPADDNRRWISLLLLALLATLSLLTARGWHRARQNLHHHPDSPASRDNPDPPGGRASADPPGNRDSTEDPETGP